MGLLNSLLTIQRHHQRDTFCLGNTMIWIIIGTLLVILGTAMLLLYAVADYGSR